MPDSKTTLESANVGPGMYNIMSNFSMSQIGKQSSGSGNLFPYNG